MIIYRDVIYSSSACTSLPPLLYIYKFRVNLYNIRMK